MTMTPREPDRYDKKARELLSHVLKRQTADESWEVELLAAALRREHDAALDEVRQYVDAMPVCTRVGVLRLLDALASPAAAPAAETCPEPPPGWETMTTGPTAGCGNIATYRDPAPAQRAEARIEELERALELAYPYVIEGDEGTEVDGLFHDQIVARINKVMRASKPGAGEGTT